VTCDVRAPGRVFWELTDGEDECQPRMAPIAPVEVDLSKPNNTRLSLSSQLFTIYLNEGNDTVTAQALATARALAMVP